MSATLEQGTSWYWTPMTPHLTSASRSKALPGMVMGKGLCAVIMVLGLECLLNKNKHTPDGKVKVGHAIVIAAPALVGVEVVWVVAADRILGGNDACPDYLH